MPRFTKRRTDDKAFISTWREFEGTLRLRWGSFPVYKNYPSAAVETPGHSKCTKHSCAHVSVGLEVNTFLVFDHFNWEL